MKKVFGFLAAAALLAAWGISVTANAIFAFDLGGETYGLIFGGASAAVDVLKVTASGVAVWLLRKRAWLPAAITTLVWASCALWGGYCLHGFAATQFSSATRPILEENSRHATQRELLDKRYASELINLQAAKTRRRPSSEIARQEALVEDLMQQIISTPIEREVNANISAIAGYGLDKTWVERGTLLGFLVVLEIIINFGYAAFYRLWERDPPKVGAQPSAPVAAPPLPDALPQATPRVPVTVYAPPAPPRLVIDNGHPTVTIDAFVDRLMVEHGGERIWTRDLQEACAAWCSEHRMDELSANHLGHALSRRGIKRTTNKDSSGRYYYQVPKVA